MGGTKHSSVNRELQFESPVVTNTSQQTTVRQSRSRQRSPTYDRNIETHVTRDVSYDSDPTIDNVITKSASSRSYSKSGEQQIVPYNEIVEVDSSTLPTELNGIPLSSNLLPGPGTKVTTTVRCKH